MKYLPLIILITTLISCKPSPAKQEDGKRYFEGFVEFENTYEGLDTQFVSLLKKGHGTKMVTYLGADGSFARENIDANAIILSREIFRPDSAKTYHFKSGTDTVYYSDVARNNNSVFVSLDKQSSFKILNHQVDIISVKRKVHSTDTDQIYYVWSTYFNDVNYPVHPLVYKNYLRNSVEQIFTRSPYITTGYKIMHGNRGTYISLAKKIVPTHVEDWHFEIPKNKIIIER